MLSPTTGRTKLNPIPATETQSTEEVKKGQINGQPTRQSRRKAFPFASVETLDHTETG